MTMPDTPVAGPVNSGTTGAVTYTLPTHQADDILLLCLETNVTAGVTCSTSGWALVPGTPRAQGSNVVSVTAYWKRATSSSETNPVGSAVANHQTGFVVRVRGVRNTDDPWAVTPLGDGEASGTDFAIATSQSTSEADTRVVLIIAGSADTATDNFNTVTGANLANFTEIEQSWTANGSGGGVGAFTGEMASPGAIGTFTGNTPAASAVTAVTIGLVGAAGAGSTNVTPADSAHAHTADATTLTQAQVLAPVDSAHAHTADAGTLTQAFTVAPVDSAHAHTSDEPTLTQGNSLAPADSSHSHTADEPALTQAQALAPSDSAHEHTSDSPTLDSDTAEVEVTPDDSTHEHGAESPSLGQAYGLSPADSFHGHTSDSPGLINPDVETPPERTFAVPAETRTAVVGPEIRVHVVSYTSRVYQVPPDDRTLTVAR